MTCEITVQVFWSGLLIPVNITLVKPSQDLSELQNSRAFSDLSLDETKPSFLFLQQKQTWDEFKHLD